MSVRRKGGRAYYATENRRRGGKEKHICVCMSVLCVECLYLFKKKIIAKKNKKRHDQKKQLKKKRKNSNEKRKKIIGSRSFKKNWKTHTHTPPRNLKKKSPPMCFVLPCDRWSFFFFLLLTHFWRKESYCCQTFLIFCKFLNSLWYFCLRSKNKKSQFFFSVFHLLTWLLE